jgi:hypothetical protein
MSPIVVTLYHDRILTVTNSSLIVSGASRFLSRRERIPLDHVAGFRMRHESTYPHGKIPRQGLSDDNVWFTKDTNRWRRHEAIEIVLKDGRAIGFSPAHASRVNDIFLKLGLANLQ